MRGFHGLAAPSALSGGAKARIAPESHGPGVPILDVARRHGVAASRSRRDARQGKPEGEASFPRLPLGAAPEAPTPYALAETELDGVAVRLPSDAAPKRIAAVVSALRKARWLSRRRRPASSS
jgi:transposase-like protein